MGYNAFIELNNSFGKKLYIKMSEITSIEECKKEDGVPFAMIGTKDGKFKVQEDIKRLILKVATEILRLDHSVTSMHED